MRSSARKDTGCRPMASSACLALILALALSGCRGQPATPTPAFSLPQVETLSDLRQALQSAGVDVGETGKLAVGAFGVEGTELSAGQARLQVYEYESPTARRAVSERIAPDGRSIGDLTMDWPDRPNIWATGRLIVVYPGTDGGTILLLSGLLGDPITFLAPPADEPYPPAISRAIGSLAEEFGLSPGLISVVRFEQVEWADACLELARPGETCDPASTAGWLIELSANGESYILHADLLGDEIRRSPGEAP